MKKLLFFALTFELASANALCGLFSNTCLMNGSGNPLLYDQAESEFNDYFINFLNNNYPEIQQNNIRNGNDPIRNGGECASKFSDIRRMYLNNSYVHELKDGSVIISSSQTADKNPDGSYSNIDSRDCVFDGNIHDIESTPLHFTQMSCVVNNKDLEEACQEDLKETQNADAKYQAVQSCPKLVSSVNKYFISRYKECLQSYDNTTCNDFLERDQDGYISTHGDYALCLSYNPFYKLINIPN